MLNIIYATDGRNIIREPYMLGIKENVDIYNYGIFSLPFIPS
jgi:hypothetical protein